MDIQQPQSVISPQILQEPAKKNTWIYIVIGVLAVILITAGLYWYFGKSSIAPIESLITEDGPLGDDLAELENFNADKSFDALEYDLTAAAGEKVVVETVSTENIEKELSDELSSLTSDLSSLESLNNDASLDNLEVGLMGAIQ